MNPYNFSLLFFSFCTFFISLMIWFKRQDQVSKVFFIFSSFVTAWGSAFSVMISPATTYEMALFSARFLNAMAAFIPTTWLHFTCTLTGRNSVSRKVMAGLYGLSVFILLISFLPSFIPLVAPVISFDYYTRPGPLFHISTLLFFTVVPLGFVQLISHLKDIEEREKSRLLGFIVATMSGFIGGAITFLPGYGIDFPQYELFLMPAYPFLMAYYLMRKSLFDLEELAYAVQRNKLAAIGTLATSINHEIRNPLYVIQGLADSHLANVSEGIYKTTDEVVEKTNDILKRTGEQATRAMEIMKRFAVFAKQSAGEKPQTEAVNLSRLVDEILPLVRHELELDKIRFERQIPAGLAPIAADKRQLEEILFNLIVNSCQAMKTAGGEISLSAERQNGHVNICVKDTGPGIPPNQLKQIFEPFYTTKQEGTGLGLYITKQLVERNGGKIKVASTLDRGTKFEVQLKAFA